MARIDNLDAFLDDIRRIRDETGAVVQVFDARCVVSRNHLLRAVELAERALERGEAVARDPAVEVLLYAAGRRQIDRALSMGVDVGTTPAVAVIYAPPGRSGGTGQGASNADVDTAADRVRDLVSDAHLVRPGTPISATDPESVHEFFDVTETELDTVAGDLTDLVLERVALLDVEK